MQNNPKELKMKYLLTHKGSYRSARMLATKLGLKSTTSHSILKSAPTIRYGNSRGNFDNDTEWNNPEVIKLCGNSHTFSQWCKENKINSPLYTPYNPNDKYKFPFLLRKAYHQSGKDIKFIKSEEDLEGINSENALYHVPFYHSDSEIGVHVVNGKVIKIFKKLPNINAHAFIRSMKFGYHYSAINDIENNYKIAQDLVLKTFELLGLGFGRADVGYNAKKKRYILFEINTSPGLNVNTSELYATYLRMVIDV